MAIYGEMTIQEAGADALSTSCEFKDTASRIPYPLPQTGIPISVTFEKRYVPTNAWRAALVPFVSGASLSFVGGTMTDAGPIDLVTWPLAGGILPKNGMGYLEDVCVTLLFNRT